MKHTLAALLIVTAGLSAPALAADVGISISIGEPGFYGQLDIGDYGRPRVVYEQPVLVERRYRNLAPLYLRVPPGHARNWRRYCERYDACFRPVYFVRDDWYQNVYAPKYRERHGRGEDRRDGRRDDRRDERRDDRHDDHGKHDRGRR